MQLILNTLSVVSEDLATELLNTVTEDEYDGLQSIVLHLSKAADLLVENEIEAPYSVTELIRLYKELHAGEMPIQQ